MQIGATFNNPGNNPAPLPDQGVAASAIRQAADLDSTIAGYYSGLNAPDTPLYADPALPSVLGTMTGVHIREQLMALNDKAASLLAEHRRDTGKPTAISLSDFRSKLALGGLTNEERHYFYSKPFKAKFEQMVAKADRAAPEARNAAMNELEALDTLLRDPSQFFKEVVATKIAKDFAEAFNAELGRNATFGAYPRA